MPRTVDEILAHADELAARFESYEPVEANEVDVTALTALRDAVAEQAQAERHVLDAIRGARNAGMSWAAIGIWSESPARPPSALSALVA